MLKMLMEYGIELDAEELRLISMMTQVVLH